LRAKRAPGASGTTNEVKIRRAATALQRVRHEALLGKMSLLAELGLDLSQSVGTIFTCHSHELLTIGIAAVDFIETAGRIPRSADDWRACENIVHEGSRFGTVKQTGT
jgi:hypothetical protein